MPLRLAPLTHADIPSLISFQHAAFTLADDVFMRDIFNGPSGDSPSGQAIATSFFESDIGAYSDEHWFKVVDDGSDGKAGKEEVIACACWAVFDRDPWSRDPEGEGVNKPVEASWLEGEGMGDHKAYVETLTEVFNQRRKGMRELRGRGHLHLYLLFTSPSHLRRGAGSLLIKWGTDTADTLGVPCVVEASLYAHKHGVYHKHGFFDYEDGAINKEGVGQGVLWPGLKASECVFMYRPAREEEWKGREGGR